MFASQMNSVGYGSYGRYGESPFSSTPQSSVIVKDVQGTEFMVMSNSVTVVSGKNEGYSASFTSSNGKVLLKNLAAVSTANYAAIESVVGATRLATLIGTTPSGSSSSGSSSSGTSLRTVPKSQILSASTATAGFRTLLVPLLAIGALSVVGLFVVPGLLKGRKKR